MEWLDGEDLRLASAGAASRWGAVMLATRVAERWGGAHARDRARDLKRVNLFLPEADRGDQVLDSGSRTAGTNPAEQTGWRSGRGLQCAEQARTGGVMTRVRMCSALAACCSSA